jgi:hypothetical protein
MCSVCASSLSNAAGTKAVGPYAGTQSPAYTTPAYDAGRCGQFPFRGAKIKLEFVHPSKVSGLRAPESPKSLVVQVFPMFGRCSE